jgi:alginate O-acetyltransferase complex protein AlgI
VLFTDARFALLAVVSWIAWANAPRRLRPAVLAASGAVFYAWYAPGSALLVFALILVVYLPAPRFWKLSAAIALSVLGYYKLLPAAGLLPIGLSFLTFELVSFAIDRGRGRTGDTSFVDYLAFALFFPCRWPGRSSVSASSESGSSGDGVVGERVRGVVRVLVGVAKKVVLAVRLGLTVDELAYAATRCTR